ncbi:hypothetical protein ACLKOZ_16915 [Arthrobacter sp. R4]|uniref:hypothetical protein n=1 Tax=Arthrobacter sp. R4 TaxID=644417 RepID=UPI003ED8CAB0
MTKTMAEVLAEHTFTTDDTCACTCDEMFYDWRRTPEEVQIEHSLHVEMELHNAGFGLVADAGAKAWDEAVNEADRQWQIGHGSAAILKADNPYRAAALRGEG